jgi:hypothetical protein
MSAQRPFYSAAHEHAFRAGSDRVQRGGPDAPVCGARTRQGRPCQNTPIREGKGRCLRHAGPHAARAHRERQLQGLRTGRVSPEEWNRAEARRAANKLSRAWRKDPWVSGTTIDLGPHEDALRADLAARGVGHDMRTLAPAVADWLRWKFRRYQIDRTDAARWEGLLRDDLPRRVKEAGPPPAGCQADALGACEAPAGGAVWTPDDNAGDARSKRQRPDLHKVEPKVRGKGYGRPGRPRTQPADPDEMEGLMKVYRQALDTVAPMIALCRTSGDQLALLRALRDFVQNPNDPGARDRWIEAAGRLRPT